MLELEKVKNLLQLKALNHAAYLMIHNDDNDAWEDEIMWEKVQEHAEEQLNAAIDQYNADAKTKDYSNLNAASASVVERVVSENMNIANEALRNYVYAQRRSSEQNIKTTSATNTYALYAMGGFLILGSLLASSYYIYNKYYDGQINATLKENIIYQGEIVANAIVNKTNQVLPDYKGRPLINLTTADDGQTILFNGQPVVIELKKKLYSFDQAPLKLSPGGQVYTETGALYRTHTPFTPR